MVTNFLYIYIYIYEMTRAFLTEINCRGLVFQSIFIEVIKLKAILTR